MIQKRYRYYLAAIVSLATLALYLGSLRHEFLLWDDQDYVRDNYHIRSLDWAFFRWAFSTFYASNWHPLTWISHALDYAVWGLNPFGHHLTNIILHAANTFFVVILYMKLRDVWIARTLTGVSADAQEGQRGLIAAGVAGLLFGLHPVHVESVVWVSERKDLLCGLLFDQPFSVYELCAPSGQKSWFCSTAIRSVLFTGEDLSAVHRFLYARTYEQADGGQSSCRAADP